MRETNISRVKYAVNNQKVRSFCAARTLHAKTAFETRREPHDTVRRSWTT